VRLAYFLSLKAHCFGWESLVIFLATLGQRLPGGWSCQSSNPRPSDSKPDAMALMGSF